MKKVYIETMGCQMNKSDTERMFGMLSNFGTSTYVLDVDLTQDDMAKIAPFAFSSGKIKIKIVCE